MRGHDDSGHLVRAWVWFRCAGEFPHVTPATEVAPTSPIAFR